MIVEILISNLAAELEKLSHTKPNERRPKEEHSRSVIFRELSCFGFSVAVERAYTPVEAGGYEECDIYGISPEGEKLWLEIKHSHCIRGWDNAPSEEVDKWVNDIQKLQQAPQDSYRLFIVVCFSDFDPLQPFHFRHDGVVRRLQGFCQNNRSNLKSFPFIWRNGDGITYFSIWAWEWVPGTMILV